MLGLGLVAMQVSASAPGPTLQQDPGQPPVASGGVIAGIVVNERQVPVANAQVHAFSVLTALPEVQPRGAVPFAGPGSGTASTDSAGRFRISGLAPGEYVVAAQVISWDPFQSSPVYAPTFHPSTVDYQAAVRVSPSMSGEPPIRIALVRVPGVRVSGSVVSSSGKTTGASRIQVYQRFGGFGTVTEIPVFVFAATSEGTFAIPQVPPGWYRLTIVAREAGQRDQGGEFATRLIQVQRSDIKGLSLRLSAGASISGRIVAEPGAGIPSAIGLGVSAGAEELGGWNYLSAAVALDWSFRMSGLPGVYRFNVSRDRAPFVKATRVLVNGLEVAGDTAVELTERAHDLVIFIAPREQPALVVSPTLSSAALVDQFRSDRSRQLEIGKAIVDRRDGSVLPMLELLLAHENREIRGNTAFVFAGLGDPRGFEVIVAILNDRSYRPTLVTLMTGRPDTVDRVQMDRSYATGLLGDLGDARAVPILAPLLHDSQVNSVVPHALRKIGGSSAIAALLEALDHEDPGVVVRAIYALEELKAKEAIPRLIKLQDDRRRRGSGTPVSVADAATAALAQLR
jgi:hypothetical protein